MLDNPHLAQALAFGMFVVLAAMMIALHTAPAPGGEVGAMKRRRFMGSLAFLWLLARRASTSCLPLVATFLFSLKGTATGKCCTAESYSWVIHNSQFWHTLQDLVPARVRDGRIGLLLFVPTIYWVHLKVPRLRPVIAFLALIPFVVPPIVMVVGLLDLSGGRRAGSTRSRGASSSPPT